MLIDKNYNNITSFPLPSSLHIPASNFKNNLNSNFAQEITHQELDTGDVDCRMEPNWHQ